jgi:predicted transposase/invertase (TIGR01784 family)
MEFPPYFVQKRVLFSVFYPLQRFLPCARFAPAMGNYDKIMRENLGTLSKTLMQYLLHVPVEEIIPLPPKLKKTVIEKEVDGLYMIKVKGGKDFIVHLEFQSTNDPLMVYRMAAYDYVTQNKYGGMEVASIVIYVGKRKLDMQNSLCFKKNYYEYELVDIRDIEPELFLSTENPKEIIFAILAGKDKKKRELIAKQIITKLHLLIPSESALLETLKDLEIISSLRGKRTEKLIKKQRETMPIVIDIRKTLLYQEAKGEGKTEGRYEERMVTAEKMLRDGVHIPLVHKYTGLPVTELEKLAEKIRTKKSRNNLSNRNSSRR